MNPALFRAATARRVAPRPAPEAGGSRPYHPTRPRPTAHATAQPPATALSRIWTPPVAAGHAAPGVQAVRYARAVEALPRTAARRSAGSAAGRAATAPVPPYVRAAASVTSRCSTRACAATRTATHGTARTSPPRRARRTPPVSAWRWGGGAPAVAAGRARLGRRAADAGGPLAQGQHATLPEPAVGAAVQMGVEYRPGDTGRQRLTVDPGGERGTGIGTVHPAMVPAAAPGPRSAPRARGSRAGAVRALGQCDAEHGGARV